MFEFDVKKFQLKNGYICYIMNFVEAVAIFNGLGICDECCKHEYIGFYVPVLNRYMCEECFYDWANRCKFYEEDLWFEKQNIEYVEERIKILSMKK